MEYYAGIDVSLECSSVCVIDASGKIVREAKVASEPEALISWFGPLGLELARIGLEAGPLSQWLYATMKKAGLAVELLETRGAIPIDCVRGMMGFAKGSTHPTSYVLIRKQSEVRLPTSGSPSLFVSILW